MIREQSSKQTVLDFYLPFDGELNSNNRWVKLAEMNPWDELGTVYNRSMHPTMGAPATSSRVVIGAMIIKHLKKLSDEEVVDDIRENPYYQYFLGFKDFQYRSIFVPRLFVEIRKRQGMEQLQEINDLFLSRIEDEEERDDPPSDPPVTLSKENNTEKLEEEPEEEKDIKRSGMLIMDATVAPSDIRYPTDVDLLNTAREKAENLIDELWEPGDGRVKPRTYRRVAHKEYLAFSHQRKPGKKKIRKAIGQQLGYLHRDLGYIDRMLDEHTDSFPLSFKAQRTLWIIRELRRQQKWMHVHHKHAIEDRIVSISQPHVRPIMRGKAKAKTEFGAKLSASVIDGTFILNRLEWDAYNECTDLLPAVERYKERFGFYPESVNADKIYWNRKNRRHLKSLDIALYGGNPLGRPLKNMPPQERKTHKAESVKRNREIACPTMLFRREGKFGTGKRRYGLGLVMAMTKSTSESCLPGGQTGIAMVIFVMNVAGVCRDQLFSLFLRFKGVRLDTFRSNSHDSVLKLSEKLDSYLGVRSPYQLQYVDIL